MIDEREIVRHAVERLAPPEPSFERLLRRRDRKRRNQRLASGIVGLAVFVLAIWIVTTGGPFDRSQTPAATGPTVPPARTPEVVVGDELGHHLLLDLRSGQSDPLPESITSLSATDLSASPDGTMIAFVSGGNVHIATVDGAAIQRLTETGDAQDPNWSPDGARIAYTTGESVLVVHVESGLTSQLTGDLGAVWEPVFSPDGSHVIFTSLNKADSGWLALWSVPLEGGPVKKFMNKAAFGAFSPDGRQIAYLCIGIDPGDGHVWVQDYLQYADSDGTNRTGCGPSGGERGYESPEWSSLRPEWSPDGSRVAWSQGGEWDWRGPGRQGGTPGPIQIVSSGYGTGRYSDYGETVAEAVHASWIDDDTLLLEDDQPR